MKSGVQVRKGGFRGGCVLERSVLCLKRLMFQTVSAFEKISQKRLLRVAVLNRSVIMIESAVSQIASNV